MKGDKKMKKLLSVLIAAAMVFSLVAILGSCSIKLPPQSPSEKFIEARKNLGAELRVGPLDRKYELDDVNFADLTAEIEAPAIIGEDNLTLSFKGGVDTDAGNLSGEIGTAYKSSDLKAKIEVADSEDLYVSFPGISEKFLYAKVSDIAEKAEEAGEDLADTSFSLDGLLNKDSKKDVKKFFEELEAKYVTDESVVVEEADVEVLGETVKGAEKLTLALTAEQLREIAEKIKETYGGLLENGDFEVDDDMTATVSLWVAGGATVRAEIKATDTENEVNAVYQMKADGGKVTANLDVTATEDGEVDSVIPLRYEHEENGGEFKGTVGVDRDKLVLSEDAEIDEDAVSVEFEGKGSEATYTFKIGAGGQTVKIPVNVKVSSAGINADNVEVTVDAEIIGVKLTVKGTVSQGSAVKVGQYDLSKGIAYSDGEPSEEDEAKLEELGEEISAKLGDFQELIQKVAGGFMGSGFGTDYDDYDYDYDDYDSDDYDDYDDYESGFDLGDLGDLFG